MSKSVSNSTKTIVIATLVILLGVATFFMVRHFNHKPSLEGKIFVQQKSSQYKKHMLLIFDVENNTGKACEISAQGYQTSETLFTYINQGDNLAIRVFIFEQRGTIEWVTENKFRFTHDGKVDTYAVQYSEDDLMGRPVQGFVEGGDF